MKKLFPFLLIVVLVISLAGCKNNDNTEDTRNQSENIQNTENTPQNSEMDTEIGTEAETQVAEEETEQPEVSNSKALQVKGAKLCDASGNPFQLRGVSTHGLAWFPQFVNKKAVADIHSWGANVLRLAMYTAEYAGYCEGGNQSELKQLVCDGVEYATENDMYAIIDWHVLNDNDPNKYVKEAKAFFKEMSAKFADYDNVLYEICNEPCNGTSWDSIKKYANAVIPVIRENDKDAIIIVGTPNWSQFVDQAAADPITGYENIMYALHFYAATHKDDLRNKMKDAAKAGLPIFVSEFGICDASGNGSIDKDSANKWVKEMDKLGISYVCWNLSNKDESSALIKSSCTKTSGFSDSDLSEEGKWLKNLLNRL